MNGCLVVTTVLPSSPHTRYTSGTGYRGDFALDDIQIGLSTDSNPLYEKLCARSGMTGRCTFPSSVTLGELV